jgi:microcystin-dependent protein
VAALPHPILEGLLDAQDNFDALARLVDLLYDPGDLKATGAAVTAGDEPQGWLLCDGRAVSRTTYAALFDAVGTTWGAGDGSTTFGLPDLQGRSPVGAGTGAGLTARPLGAMLGEEAHALSIAELAAHDHGGATGNPLGWATTDVYGAGGATNFKILSWGGAFIGNDSRKFTDADHTHLIAAQGAGAAHNNMPPVAAVNFLIKT